ncbi:MAG: hypothetical protein ACJ8GN_28255 [Longimicrobiaceae bacterium]
MTSGGGAEPRHSRSAWQPWAAVGSFAVLLNFPWEMLQAPFFTALATAPHWAATLECARMAAADAVVVVACYGAASLASRSRWWLLRPSLPPLAVFVGAGLAFTICTEMLSVWRWKRWSYTPSMPVLGGVGVVPLVQWTVLPPLTLWLARRHVAFGGERAGDHAELRR